MEAGLDSFYDDRGRTTTVEVDPHKLSCRKSSAVKLWCGRETVLWESTVAWFERVFNEILQRNAKPCQLSDTSPSKTVRFSPKVKGERVDYEIRWHKGVTENGQDTGVCQVRRNNTWYQMESIESGIWMEALVGSAHPQTLAHYNTVKNSPFMELVTHLGGSRFERITHGVHVEPYHSDTWTKWREWNDNSTYEEVIYPTFYAFLPHLLKEKTRSTTVLEICGGDGIVARAALEGPYGHRIKKWVLVERNPILAQQAVDLLQDYHREGRVQVIVGDVTEFNYAGLMDEDEKVDLFLGIGAMEVRTLPSRQKCLDILHGQLPSIMSSGAKIYLSSCSTPYISSDDLGAANIYVTNTHCPLHRGAGGSTPAYVGIYS